jgi:hypothetical protein
MTYTQKRRLYQLANLIEKDGLEWNYKCINSCAYPRAEKILGGCANDSKLSDYFGILTCDIPQLFNVESTIQRNRRWVANRFRKYADKEYKRSK